MCRLVEQAARKELAALKATWACSHPEVRDYVVQSGRDGGSTAEGGC
jgi:hypothetical protein